MWDTGCYNLSFDSEMLFGAFFWRTQEIFDYNTDEKSHLKYSILKYECICKEHQLLSESSEALQNSLIHESQHLICYSLMFLCSSSKEINFSARGRFDLVQFCNIRKCYPECLQK